VPHSRWCLLHSGASFTAVPPSQRCLLHSGASFTAVPQAPSAVCGLISVVACHGARNPFLSSVPHLKKRRNRKHIAQWCKLSPLQVSSEVELLEEWKCPNTEVHDINRQILKASFISSTFAL
jgi:hypothetical protein